MLTERGLIPVMHWDWQEPATAFLLGAAAAEADAVRIYRKHGLEVSSARRGRGIGEDDEGVVARS
jgi:hypothetical protein